MTSLHDFSHSVESLAEALTVIRRLWTETEPFDFTGTTVRLTGAFGNPKPVQRPHPPILIGGRSAALLRVVAEHADLWNIPGHDIDDAINRSTLLDRYCAEIGRAIDAGFLHVVLGLASPYPVGIAQWVVDELITTAGS